MGRIVIILMMLGLVIFSTGCSQQSNNSLASNSPDTNVNAASEQKVLPSIEIKPKLSTKQPSELILSASDIGDGYSTKESGPRLKSDVSEEGLSLGWKDGYYVRYARIGEDVFDVTVVEQWISVYPIENVSKNVETSKESNENVTYEELPSPNIGDKSRAWRVTTTDEWEDTSRYYSIEFTRMDVYERLDMGGNTNYETLKSLAKKAEEQIK